jgi:predicted dehydrogenase
MNELLRVGIIGCGAIAQIMHIPYIIDYDDRFKLVAASDIDKGVLDAVADHYSIPSRYTNYQDLLAHDDIDAVFICHGGSHYDTIIAALDAGKHIFVEKPITWNVREAEDVAERVAKSDRVVQVGYHKLYDPAFGYAKKQVEQMQDLGYARITVLHPDNYLGLSPYRIRRGNGAVLEGHVDVSSWDAAVRGQLQAFATGVMAPLVDEVLGARQDDDRLRLGYGLLAASLIHQVYMMYAFLGEPKAVVSAEMWRDGLSIHAVIEYPQDIRCTLDWHYLSHVKDYREEYAFYGNHDRVLLQFPSPYLRNFPSPVIVQGGSGELAWEKRIIVSHDEAFRNEILAFYDNVRSASTPVSSVYEAVLHMDFLQQLINAVR